MQAVGVKKLKARLSEYLRLVRAGETVLVTDRDQVVAELRPARRQERVSDDPVTALERLADRGRVTQAAVSAAGWSWQVDGLGMPKGTAGKLLDRLRRDRD